MLPPGAADRLREKFRFYDWDAATGEVRWMCAFDTTEADVDAFAAAIREELATVPAVDASSQSRTGAGLRPPPWSGAGNNHRSLVVHT